MMDNRVKIICPVYKGWRYVKFNDIHKYSSRKNNNKGDFCAQKGPYYT